MAKIESALARINASQETYQFSFLCGSGIYYLYRNQRAGLEKTLLAYWSHHWTKECVASIERLEREISAGNLEWAPRDNN
jgi:hypothetical protein